MASTSTATRTRSRATWPAGCLATWLVGLALASCGGAPQPPSTPTAEIARVRGAWSYCETPASLSLSQENARVVASDVLRDRSDTQYDLLIVPGYTPDNEDKPDATVHPIAAERLDEAIALYKQRKARIILVAGGNVHPAGTPYTEAMTMKAYLLKQGIPERAIVVEPCARHSTTNLRNAGRFMLKYHLRTALVVTSLDQSFYFGKGTLSTFDLRSRAQLGYVVGRLKSASATTVEFAPSKAVLRVGTDPLDP